MEKTLMDEATASSSLALVRVLFFLMIIKWLIVQFFLNLSSLRYALQFFISYLLDSGLRNVCRDDQTKIATINKPICIKDDTKNLCRKKLCIGELAEVMGNIGSLCDNNGAMEIGEMLEEEPSLEEVKEAFGLFDENGDGSIDAGEVKRVLHALGFIQASDLECKKMIESFDQNGDGVIDFEEFVKLMEDSFSRNEEPNEL